MHKSTNAKDQERDFCQSSDHVSIATDREQQDWHKLELWLQLTCKCWKGWCSFTFFHVSSHCCKWSKSNRIPQNTFVLSIHWNSSSAFCSCPCFACTKWKILMRWILVEQAPSILNAPHFGYMPTKLLPTYSSESQTLFNDVHMDPHALFKCKYKFKLANKHRNRQWDQHQQSTQHQAAKENQLPLTCLRKTNSQQKTVSWSPTIHLSQCAGGCGFALAPCLNPDFSHQRTGHSQPIFLIQLSIGQAQIILQTLVCKISKFKHS